MNLSEMRRVAESASAPHGGLYENQLRTIPMAIYQDEMTPENCIRLLDVMEMMAEALEVSQLEIKMGGSRAIDRELLIVRVSKALAAYNELKGE